MSNIEEKMNISNQGMSIFAMFSMEVEIGKQQQINFKFCLWSSNLAEMHMDKGLND